MEWETGTEVIYGLMGKCLIDAVKKMNVGGEEKSFFELSRVGAARGKFLIPAHRSHSIRLPLQKAQVEKFVSILKSDEHFLPLEKRWKDAMKNIESMIDREGIFGFAKSISYLEAIKSKRSHNKEEKQIYDQLLGQVAREWADLNSVTILKATEEVLSFINPKKSIAQ